MAPAPEGAGEGPDIETTDGLEFRADGRTLSGWAIRYGAPGRNPRTGRPERFAPGAFRVTEANEPLELRAHHDGRVVYVPLPVEFREEGLRLEIDLDPATARRVERGEFRGLSVGFEALAEHEEDGVRVIDRARLDHVALAGRPAYPSSKIEMRAEADSGLWRLL